MNIAIGCLGLFGAAVMFLRESRPARHRILNGRGPGTAAATAGYDATGSVSPGRTRDRHGNLAQGIGLASTRRAEPVHQLRDRAAAGAGCRRHVQPGDRPGRQRVLRRWAAVAAATGPARSKPVGSAAPARGQISHGGRDGRRRHRPARHGDRADALEDVSAGIRSAASGPGHPLEAPRVPSGLRCECNRSSGRW